MDKFELLRQRKAAVEALDEQSSVAVAAYQAAQGTPRPTPTPAPLSKFEQKQALANSALGFEIRGLPHGAEIERITSMQLVQPMDEAELKAYNDENTLAGTNFELFPVQAEAMLAYDTFSGLFAPVGVGFGKTLVSLSVANKAYQKGMKKILLCVPSNVLCQLTTTDIKWVRTRIPFNIPVHIVGGKDAPARRALTQSGKKGLYIMPYSYLSVKDTEDMLNGIRPELIICDEAHNLANKTSARTRRIMAYVEKHRPEGVALSGTITSKTIRDYFHLIKWCLGEFNPLPNSMVLANEWGAVIDAEAGWGADRERPSSPLMPLIRWAQKHFGNIKNPLAELDPTQPAFLPFREDLPSFRRAYKLRMTSAPGVVSSGDAAIKVSLIIANSPIENKESVPGWDALKKLCDKVEHEWLTPNNDEIEHAIHCWKWLYELWGAGFYNQLIWPTPDEYAKRKKISVQEATDILEKARKHHAAGQVYAKELRKWLQGQSFKGCDTPFLVGLEMSRNGGDNVSPQLFEYWQDWKLLDFEGRPERDSHAIRVCPFKINNAVSWAKDLNSKRGGYSSGGIIWVGHREVGEWCYEELVKAGVDALHCPAGPQHNEAICAIGTPDTGGKGDRIVVASYHAHGEGKNLQAFQHTYFLEWPRESRKAQQTIGRTHRNGQKADELVVTTNHTTEFDKYLFAACLNDSLYVHQTTGDRQKLIYATYNPLPSIFPSAVLQERGLEPRMLSQAQQAVLKERFGG